MEVLSKTPHNNEQQKTINKNNKYLLKTFIKEGVFRDINSLKNFDKMLIYK